MLSEEVVKCSQEKSEVLQLAKAARLFPRQIDDRCENGKRSFVHPRHHLNATRDWVAPSPQQALYHSYTLTRLNVYLGSDEDDEMDLNICIDAKLCTLQATVK